VLTLVRIPYQRVEQDLCNLVLRFAKAVPPLSATSVAP